MITLGSGINYIKSLLPSSGTQQANNNENNDLIKIDNIPMIISNTYFDGNNCYLQSFDPYNLNEAVNISGFKNEAPQFPYFRPNDNQIRLYGYRATGNGNQLIISTHSGYVLESVKFNLQASSSSVDPSAIMLIEVDPSAAAAVSYNSENGICLIEGINSTYLLIKNVASEADASSNVQLRINNLEITYRRLA